MGVESQLYMEIMAYPHFFYGLNMDYMGKQWGNHGKIWDHHGKTVKSVGKPCGNPL
jgi:hypothetical protein